MKNFKYFFLSLTIFSCASNSESISEESRRIDSLQSVLSSKDQAINSLEFQKLNDDSIVNLYALYIQKIKDNINEINKQELIINNKKNNPDFIDKDTTDIIKSIKILSKKLQENESMITALNNAVKQEKNKNSQFASKVTDLKEEIARSNREVYYLKEELNSMNASFEAIFKKYNLQNKKISDLNQKLNEVAYVIGSKSELLDNGVLTKSGGLIGIGKTRKLNSDLNTEYFTYASKYNLLNITLGYKTVRLMTSHPSNSYRLSNVNEIIDSLIIINQDDFWRNSKFLVIEVK
jgi:predicted RNase H-like nuclease (RuvC/YqgF family)